MSSFTKSISFIKSLLIKILLVIILGVLAITFIEKYINEGDKEKISQLNQMIDEHTTVTADLSEHYIKETLFKSITHYKFDYSFDLNGTNYSGKIYLKGVPDTNKLTIYYLSSDPSIVSADPVHDLENEQDSRSVSSLITGIVLALITGILILSIVMMFKKDDKTKQAEAEPAPKTKTVEEKKVAEKPVVRPAEETTGEPEMDKEDPRRFMPH
ncbi:MAG: hypothetical protein J5808_01695 [Paludibacteraceae bacterium]|nr:hypothetical protein [Paludibacteraceae bacterium]